MLSSHFKLVITLLIAITYIALIALQPSLQLWPKSIVWFVDRQRILELLLLSLVLIECLINPTKKATIPINKATFWAFITLFILSCFSTALAYSPRHAAIELSTFIALGYLSMFIAKLYQEDNVKCIKGLSYIIWGSILLYLLSFFTGYLTATIFNQPLSWPQPFTGFSNIRSFNQYQLWTLGFLTIPLVWLDLKKPTRTILNTALIAWWVLLFYSASRGVLIAWAIAMLLTAVFYKKIAWPFIKTQIVHITLGLLCFNLFFKIIPTANQSPLNASTIIRGNIHDRLALWDQAILMIKSFPIFGAGPMHFAWYNDTNAHPHNSVLQLASEWGLPATLIILSIFGYALYLWSRKFSLNNLSKESRLNKNVAVILFFTLSANFAYSLVDGVIVTPISQVLMFTTIGLMLGQYITSNKLIHILKSGTRTYLAVLTLILMAWSTYPEIEQGFSREEKGFSMGYTAIGPRFWFEIK